MVRLPPLLFKYGKQIHAEALVRDGQIRVGTLYNYRNVEQLGLMIGDAQEGWKERYDAPPVATLATLSRFAAPIAAQTMLSLVGGGPVDASTIGFFDCTFNRPEASPNCWLYCTSARLGASVMRSMDPAYDTCVRIDYVQAFFETLGNELTRLNLSTRGVIVPCRYRERSQHYLADDGLAPFVLKDPSYAEQKEVRFVYFAAKPITIEYRDLTIPKLKDFCELDLRLDIID